MIMVVTTFGSKKILNTGYTLKPALDRGEENKQKDEKVQKVENR